MIKRFEDPNIGFSPIPVNVGRMEKYSLIPGKFSNASMNFTTLGLPSSASLLHNRIFAK